MRAPQTPRADVGVIVGRFQTHELTEGHRDLIDTVRSRHEKVVIVLGLSPLMNTTRNPLPFQPRKEMILSEYPDVTVMYVKDTPSDAVWSARLDTVVGDVTGPLQGVVLYGSRDSFISSYLGRYATEQWEPTIIVSASQVREGLRAKTFDSPAFRAGMVAAALNRFPVSYTTVDVGIFDDDSRILLARKPDEARYRLIGGFVDPGDATFEAAARREVQEEAGVAITDPVYMGSHLVDDWRYRSEVDKIKTAVFSAHIMFGSPQPNDDIVELRWFELHDLTANMIDLVVQEHQPLMTMLGINWADFK